MNRLATILSLGCERRSYYLGSLLLILCIFGLHTESRAVTITLTYDASGNQSTQQATNATPPTIAGQPNSKQVVAPGGSVGFSVNVASVLPVTYQWYFNGTAISGATGDSYLLTNFTAAMAGNYTVKVTNSSGSVTSAVATPYIDANGNGLPDSWEVAYFGNYNQTAAGDYDGDGITNIQEFYEGTDPTVRQVYHWIAQSGNFNTAANWDRDRVPGPGDTCVITSGTFTIPSNTQITTSNVTVTVPFTTPTDSDYTLNITGNWTFNGAVTLASGRSFIVTGGGTATLAGTTSFSGANLYVHGTNSKLIVSGATSLTQAANVGVAWTTGQNYEDNTGCELDFPNLITITTNVATSTSINSALGIMAQYGAAINLPVLASISTAAGTTPNYSTSGVNLSAHDSGTLNAALLTTFADHTTNPASSLVAYGNGTLALAKLATPVGVQMNLNALSHPERFTSLAGTSYFRLNNGVVTMQVSDLSGLTYLLADGTGTKLSFPQVSSYHQPANTQVNWVAGQNYQDNTGCELDLPALASITGSVAGGSSINCTFNVTAQYGATVNLSGLSGISVPGGTTPNYSSSGVGLSAHDSGTLNAAQLSSFVDNTTNPGSALTAYNNGTLALAALALSGIKGVTLNGVTLPATIQPVPVVSAVKSGSNIILTVQTMAGHTYQLQETSSLTFGNWQSVGTAQSGTGNAMNFTAPIQGTMQFYKIVIFPWP